MAYALSSSSAHWHVMAPFTAVPGIVRLCLVMQLSQRALLINGGGPTLLIQCCILKIGQQCKKLSGEDSFHAAIVAK